MKVVKKSVTDITKNPGLFTLINKAIKTHPIKEKRGIYFFHSILFLLDTIDITQKIIQHNAKNDK